MNSAWQNAVALVVVAGASLYILRGFVRLCRSFRNRDGGTPPCGACKSCSAGAADNRGAAVTIDVHRSV